MSVGDDKNDLYWKLLKHQVQEKRIEKVFRTFAESGIETLLIKGWAAARNYPKPFERWSVDIDAAVRPDNFERGEQLLKEQDMRGVDLHKGLRHLDAVGWDDLYANAETVDIGAAKVRIPRAEDHLRILCVHWLNDGGADKEKLRDILYAVQNRPDEFDWRRCLDAAGARRRRWVVCTIGLAEKYLGLDLSGTPLEHEAKNLPGWLVKTVEREWKRGIRLKPLDTCFADRRELYEQIKIRMPPNPIQATVEMNGDFDGKTRLQYQIGTLFIRLKLSIAKIQRSLRTGDGKTNGLIQTKMRSEIKIQTEKTERRAVLAIETAVEGGSFALFYENRKIDGWVGSREVSKSEDVLSEIERILQKNEIEKKRIKLIVVSNGPGSFTGIRIGAATAFGLAKALGCDIAAKSVFEAMTSILPRNESTEASTQASTEFLKEKEEQRILTVIPFGKTQICLQKIVYKHGGRLSAAQNPRIENRSALFSEIGDADFDKIILHETLYLDVLNVIKENNEKTIFKKTAAIVNAGFNLAELIGKRAIFDGEDLSCKTKLITPSYVRNLR